MSKPKTTQCPKCVQRERKKEKRWDVIGRCVAVFAVAYVIFQIGYIGYSIAEMKWRYYDGPGSQAEFWKKMYESRATP